MSPHFDDAALSLGASIARASRSGVAVTIVTVFGGDVDNGEAAGKWDRRCGFATAGEAARRRRGEDERACEILGAEPKWLSFGDEQYERGGTEVEVWCELGPILKGAQLVALPGHPLVNRDHAWLTRMILERRIRAPVALYVEQPYAADETIGRRPALLSLLRAAGLASATGFGRWGRPPTTPAMIHSVAHTGIEWDCLRPTLRERRLKDASIRAYETQLDGLGRHVRLRIGVHELVSGGERVGVLDNSH